MKLNILVLGGTQFVGRNLVEELQRQTEHEITLLNRGNKPLNIPGVKHIQGDRKDKVKITQVLRGKRFDIVYDISGYTREDTQWVVEALEEKPRKYIYISTAAVYLPQQCYPIPETASTGKHPVWGEYGGDKLAAERYLLEQYTEQGLPVVIVRPSYLYGRYNHIPRETYVFEHLVHTRPILLPNGGTAITQFGHIFDLVEVFIRLIDIDGVAGEVFNVSATEYHSLRGLVEVATQVTGIEAEIREVEMGQFDGMTDRDIFPFDNQSYFTDVAKAEKILAYEPQYDLEKGMRLEWERFEASEEYWMPREREALERLGS